MLDNLRIKNFKGLAEISVEDCKQVNLLIGKNNCGKTSILEALFLSCTPTNVAALLAMFTIRGMKLERIDGLSWLFHKMDLSSVISIACDTDSFQDRELTISALVEQVAAFTKERWSPPGPTAGLKGQVGFNEASEKSATPLPGTLASVDSLFPSDSEIASVKFGFSFVSKADGAQFNNEIIIDRKSGLIPHEKVDDMTGFIKGFYHNTTTTVQDVSKRFHDENIHKRKESIIKVLKKIDPMLQDLTMGYDGIYYDIGLPTFLPLSLLGDGITRIFSIMLSFQNSKDGILMVDEIENGLHYSSLSILWEIVLEMSRELNVQVFATTHSMECVKALHAVYRKDPSLFAKEDNVRVYRVEREEKSSKSVKMTPEDLDTMLSQNWEIR